MGLDRFNKTPCGFCFVEYYNHQDALDCMKYIGGTKLDERIIRTDLDPGFQEGRQYGCVPWAALKCSDGLAKHQVDAENRAARSVMSTETNTIQVEVATDEPLTPSD